MGTVPGPNDANAKPRHHVKAMIRLRTPQFDSLLALDAALGITYGVFIGTIASLLSKLLGALAAVYIGRRIWHAFEGARGAGCDQVRLANSAGRASSVRTG